jgi:hypothetical protein
MGAENGRGDEPDPATDHGHRVLEGCCCIPWWGGNDGANDEASGGIRGGQAVLGAVRSDLEVVAAGG